MKKGSKAKRSEFNPGAEGLRGEEDDVLLKIIAAQSRVIEALASAVTAMSMTEDDDDDGEGDDEEGEDEDREEKG